MFHQTRREPFEPIRDVQLKFLYKIFKNQNENETIERRNEDKRIYVVEISQIFIVLSRLAETM